MRYRIVVIETTSMPDHDFDSRMYGAFKYGKAEDAEADAHAIIKAMALVGIKTKAAIESDEASR